MSPARPPFPWAFAAGLALAGTLFAGPAGGAAPAAVDRPDPPGTLTEVRVGIFLMDLASIDDASQTFSADFFLIRRWRDPRLAFEGTRQRYQGTLASPLNLRSFPFDGQQLPILVASLQEADQVAL